LPFNYIFKLLLFANKLCFTIDDEYFGWP
jgi:hypothetical protein